MRRGFEARSGIPTLSRSGIGHPGLKRNTGSVAKFKGRLWYGRKSMPITPTNPFKGRQYPGEVILQAVRWYLRYPLAYRHVSEILSERGLFVDASCVWRWVQAYAP